MKGHDPLDHSSLSGRLNTRLTAWTPALETLTLSVGVFEYCGSY